MPKIIVTISGELDSRLRSHIRTRGDLSGLVSDAATAYLDRLDKRQTIQVASTVLEPIEFSRSQRFGVGLLARLTVASNEVVVEVSVDQPFRDRYVERELNNLYREKQDLQFPPLEHASREDINKVKGVSMEERAERAFFSYIEERLQPIRTWTERQLHYHHCENLPIKLCFDQESGLWLCTHCDHVSEGQECWTCGHPPHADELDE